MELSPAIRFRLTRIQGEPKLLAPSVPEAQPATEPVKLAVGQPRGRRNACAEKGRLFQFAAAHNG